MKTVLISESELARHWSMTTRRVRQLRGEGVAVASGGQYDLIASDRKLLDWLRRDEETKRIKRRLLAQEGQIKERKMQRSDREFLTLKEVRDVLNQAWSRMWITHANVANSVLNATWQIDAQARTAMALEVERNCKGELRLLADAFETLQKEAAAKMDCELRNGLFRVTRNLEVLKAEYGDASDDA